MTGPWINGSVIRCTLAHEVDYDEDRQESRRAEVGAIGVITDDQATRSNPFVVVWENESWGFYTEDELEGGTEPILVPGRDFTISPHNDEENRT